MEKLQISRETLLRYIGDIEVILMIILDGCEESEQENEQAYQYIPVHNRDIKQVLDRAAVDNDFLAGLLFNRPHVLDIYNLSGEEKAAIFSGDIRWIESRIGPLSDTQKIWFDNRLSAEVW